MLRKLLASAAIGAVAALSFALLSNLFDSSIPRGQAQAPTVKRSTPRPLTAVKAPPAVLDGLISQAKRAEVADLATAGTAGNLAFGRSIVIGRSRSGAREAAIIDSDGHSSFMTPAQIFDHSPLAVFSSQAGTAATVRAASIAVFLRPEVARVAVEEANGSTHDASAITWPTGGYASFTEVAQDPSRFPRLVRAYAANGALLATQETRIGPMCSPSEASCVR